jgi:tripartite-type tricarboxylate transporter receptor subunit TctC
MNPRLIRTAAAAVLAAQALAAHAAYPDKPIRIVIGFPDGGPLDQHARLLSDKLPYNTLKDFTPLARTAMQPLALLDGDEFGKYLVQETPRWAAAVKTSGARLD